ncbi:MAG: FAD-dependent thymidylate synthase [Thermodesulfobacteria bacterium]|nr:FAD-dependent thymidylate synthase [Thermodesulfobacteriota bacterium]
MRVILPSFEVLDHYFREGRVLEQIERCGRVCYKSEDKITEESAVPFIKGIIKRGHESVIEMANLVLEVTAPEETFYNDFFVHIPRFCQASRLSTGRFLISGNPRSFRDLARRLPDAPLIAAMKEELEGHYPVLFEDIKVSAEANPKIDVKLLSPQEVDALDVPLLVKHRCLLCHIIVNRAVTHELVRHRVASYLQESQRYCRYGEDKFGGEVTFIKPCFFQEGSGEYQLWEKAMEETEKIYLELLKTSSPQAARTVLPNSCKTEIMVHATLEEWQHIFRLRASKAADPSMREIMLMMLPEFERRFPQVFEGIAA